MDKKAAVLLMALAQSVYATETTQLVLTGVENTTDEGIFYLKNNNDDFKIKLDCRSFINYLYVRSPSDMSKNFDFMIESYECDEILQESKLASDKSPTCIDVNPEENYIAIDKKCEYKK